MSARNENDPNKEVTHIRRCHVCGTVNECEGSFIFKCDHCGKTFAPFYFFEEINLEGIAEDQLHLSAWKSSASYNPIWGLSTYW